MAKVKGGLGETSLSQDLTKPISFHISEALEAPPVFERRKGEKEKAPPTQKKVERGTSPQALLDKAAGLLQGEGVEIFFHFRGENGVLCLENKSGLGESGYAQRALAGNRGEYSDILWEDSAFADVNIEEDLSGLTGCIARVEVVTDEDFANFSSLGDFMEWLEL